MKFKPPEGHRSFMVGLTTGHSIVIDESGTEVPPQFRKAAIAHGCSPIGIGAVDAPVQEESSRSKLIEDGIGKMLDSDDDGAFTADGKPDTRKLSAVVGFQVSREERDTAWTKLSANGPIEA